MRKIGYLCVALLTLGASQAHALDGIKTNEVHKFVNELSYALNNPTSYAGRDFLNTRLSNNIVFENNVQRTTPYAYGHAYYGYGHAYGYGNGYWATTAAVTNPYYYRYPYYGYTHHQTASFQNMNKFDLINNIERKKVSTAGYSVKLDVTEINMSAIRDVAVVDIDLRESAHAYTPYAYHYASNGLMSFSRCKLYLSEHNDTVYMRRMDCNTNSVNWL